MSSKIFMVIFFLGICICSGQDRFFINHLIENDREVHRPFNNEPISGKVYRSFSDSIIEPKFVGNVKRSYKEGLWTRWWDNGSKKIQGKYNKGVKDEFWHEWDELGVLRFELFYEKGNVIQLKNCLVDPCDSLWIQKEMQIKF